MTKVTDIIVKTGNPAALDQILNTFGAAVIQSDIDKQIYLEKEGGYVVRCFGNVDFIKFALKNQGYGEFVRSLEDLV